MSRNDTITVTTTLVVEECCNCGIMWAMPDDFVRRQRDLGPGGQFFCPNGHPQHYTGKPMSEQLREAKRRQANAEEEARIAWAETERLRKEQRIADRRARAAACPVPGCNRTFVQLGRHLHAKHPEFVHPEAMQ